MPEIMTFHGPVYQKLLREKDIIREIPCIEIDTLLHPWDPEVKKECIAYFFGRNYVKWTSDKKTAIKLTAGGKFAYEEWFAKPPFDPNGKPKGDFM